MSTPSMSKIAAPLLTATGTAAPAGGTSRARRARTRAASTSPPPLGVLGAGLEEKADPAAGDRDLEVAVLLVAALVEGEGHPGVVGWVHGAPRVAGHVGEGLGPAHAGHVGEELAADRLELGADAGLDRVHAGLEPRDLEYLEVGRGEPGEGHAGPSLSTPRRTPGRGRAGRWGAGCAGSRSAPG